MAIPSTALTSGRPVPVYSIVHLKNGTTDPPNDMKKARKGATQHGKPQHIRSHKIQD